MKPYGTERFLIHILRWNFNTFKNYNEYRIILVKGAEDKVSLKPYAASAETCSDICTQTQYVKFPVSNEIFNEAPFKDLIF